MLLLAMIFKAVPWDHSTWNKTFYVTSNIQPGDLYAEKKVLSELKQIREEIDDSQRSYSPEMIYSHLLRLVTLRNHTQDPYLTERIRVVLEYASHTRSAQNRYSDLSFKLSKLVNNEEYKKATSFSPTTNHIDLGPLWQYETQNYWLTILLAIPFWIFWRFRQGYNPLLDLHRPLSLIFAIALWPVGMYFLLAQEPVRKILWLVRVVTCIPCYAVTFVLSCFSLGVVKAQENHRAEEGQDDAELSEAIQSPTAKPVTLTFLGLADEKHARQIIVTLTKGNFTLVSHELKNLETGAASSLFAAGTNFRVGSHVTLVVAFGPQYNLLQQKVDAAGGFVNANVSLPWFRLTLVNRLTFGFERSKTASTDRHIQTLRGPPDCSGKLCKAFSGIGVNLEQKHVAASGAWTENDIGLLVNPAQIFRVPNNRWGKMAKIVNFYVYYDTARNLCDRRLWLSYSHQFSK